MTVDLSRARFLADPAALWEHAYAEAGRLLRRDFWTPGMSEVDWDGVLGSYRFLLSRIGSSLEFADLLYEVAAELGTSHAYVMNTTEFTARTSARGAAAALLGADVSRAPDGRWLVERVLPGESSDPRARSPLAAPGVAVLAGDEILEVDGRPVDPVHGPWPALAGTAGKPVELTIRPADPSLVPVPPTGARGRRGRGRRGSDSAKPDRLPRTARRLLEARLTPRRLRQAPRSPTTRRRPRSRPTADAAQGMETRRVVVVPLRDERRLRYQDWVAGRRQFVRARSDGRIGYLHVPDMMGEGWAHLHRDLRAEMGREALIVDVRGNRGGHTSQLIVEKLARRIIGWELRPLAAPGELPGRGAARPGGRAGRRVRRLGRRHRDRGDPLAAARPGDRRPHLGRRGRHRRGRARPGRRHPYHRARGTRSGSATSAGGWRTTAWTRTPRC